MTMSVVNVVSRIEVVEVEQDNFRNHSDHLRKLYTERNKDMNNQPLDFAGAVWFNFGNGEKVADGKLVVF